jgi:hypothetical protein
MIDLETAAPLLWLMELANILAFNTESGLLHLI